MRKLFPAIIIQFLKIYLLTLVLFALFRLLLFVSEISRIDNSVQVSDIFLSFFMGIRFDTVIICYILILPYVILSLISFFNKEFRWLYKTVYLYIFILFSIAFIICSIDIPYFNQFFSRLTITALEWIDSPVFVFEMIVQEPRYWLYVIPLVIVLFVFYKILRKIFFKISCTYNGSVYLNIVFFLLFLGLMVLGIRGRIEKKSPIRIGTAYFSNNAFINQLGLNPNFTLIRSYLDSKKEEYKKVKLMDEKEAIKNVQQYLNIPLANVKNPIQRQVNFDSSEAKKYNVVLVIMESMSAAKMKRHGNINNLTPFLDSLSNQGYYFENTYTSGIHTYNGVFSTLFSYPALFRQHPMKQSSMLKYHGIFSTLKEKGYSTIYFTTHDGQFDNIEGFLKENDCERVVSESDYPSDKVKTTLGVPDDYMFEYSIPVLNELSKNEKPFIAAFMTASDHGPYYLPEYFKPFNKSIENQMVEYADFSLKKFIQLSSTQKWFKNTIFVFIADHGSPIDATYEMSLDYNHSPLIFYAPFIIKEHKVFENMAGQIDVFPSIMGLLKLPYQNNTLGINLFNETRPYIFFSADDKFGVIDKEWFLTVRDDGSKYLYHYRNKDKTNYVEKEKDIANKMTKYGKSNMQVFQYLMNAHKQ